jgi:hypothetical protein
LEAEPPERPYGRLSSMKVFRLQRLTVTQFAMSGGNDRFCIIFLTVT